MTTFQAIIALWGIIMIASILYTLYQGRRIRKITKEIEDMIDRWEW